jgi:Immunoglobulin domain/Immunoglobulin I-set domain
MKYFIQILPVLLAATLQIMPLVRNLFVNPAGSSAFAFILRWGIGPVAALESVDAVSGATSTFTTPSAFNGSVGTSFSNNVSVSIGGGNTAASSDFFTISATTGTNASATMGNGQSATNNLPPGLIFTASWVNGASTIGGIISGTPTVAGVYPATVTVVSPGNAQLSQNITITITASTGPVAPTITTQPVGQTNAVGTSAVFSVTAAGTGPLQYLWFKDDSPLADGPGVTGSTSNILTLQSISTNTCGTYFVTVSNALGGVVSSNAVLDVLSPPVILVPPTAVNAATGSVATFTVIAEGTSPLSYRWLRNNLTITNGTKFTGVSSNVLSVLKLTTNDSGNFTVVITNSAGAVTSSPVALSVQLPVTFTLQASNRAVKAGSNTVFGAAVKGTAPFFYQWLKNGVPLADGGNISGSASNVLTVASVTTNDAALYSLAVSNAVASLTSSNAQLTVLVPPGITVPPTNLTVLVSNAASFSVDVSGTAPFHYQWKKSASVAGKTTVTVITGATNAVYSIPVAGTNAAGSYFVVVTNRAGSITSSPAILTILKPARAMKTATVNPSATGILTGEFGGPVKISVQPDGTIRISLIGTPGASYTLQAADNLTAPDWQNLGRAPAQADGTWQMIDSGAQPLRFYRVFSP